MKTVTIKVGYSTNIPIAPYGIKDSVWSEIEWNLEGEEPDFDKLLSDLKNTVDQSVKNKYPHLYNQQGVKLDWKEESPGIYIGGISVPIIQSCTSLKTLEIYEPFIDREKDVDKKRELWMAYDNKFKELSASDK